MIVSDTVEMILNKQFVNMPAILSKPDNKLIKSINKVKQSRIKFVILFM